MAVIITPEIRGQECNEAITYSYLFEPLRINIEETNPLATKLYVEVERYNIVDKTVLVPFLNGVNSLPKYVEIDLIPNRPVTFDLSEVMQQLHLAGVYKVATLSEIELSYEEMIVSKYIYLFKVTSDLSSEPAIVKKLPIIGGRTFGQFDASVLDTQVLNEFEYFGLDQDEIAKRWSNFIFYKAALKDVNSGNNLQPAVSTISSPTVLTPEGGVLYWKSRFGGWMFWGFDLEKRNSSNSYQGDLGVSMFESTKKQNGDPYIPVDYISIESSYTLELKSLGLSKLELQAVAGIDSSPAIYYAANNSGKLELMRLASSTSPYSNLATGGDFTVSLKAISKTSQKTA